MESWTSDRVAALAPDSASSAAGQALANARKWSKLGRSDRAIWGLCQGSGKQPYQARVDLGEPAFKCSCPSRKFPCKHGLALLFLFARSADVFPTGDEPGWVADWIGERVARATKKAEQAKTAVERPVDLEAQAKRAAQRDARVRDGIAICRVWLEDLVRRGLAAAQGDPAANWERAAARLVDAQAPGLASFIRRIPGMMASGPGWDARTVDLLGRMYLLLRAAERLDELPEDLAVDVRTALGWTQSREDALASPGVADRWTAIGQVIEEDERFRAVRTWLLGRNTGRHALILEFVAGTQPLERTILPGSSFEGELGFYPSRQPLRALLKSRSATFPLDADFTRAEHFTIEVGLMKYAQALAANPWTFRWPILLAAARPVLDGTRWVLVDAKGEGLPIRPSFTRTLQLWRLVSGSGESAMTLLVEWDGVSALPVSAFSEQSPREYLDLTQRWAA